MNRQLVFSLVLSCALAPALAAAQTPMSSSLPAVAPMKMSPMPTAAEQPFVAKIQRDIPPRFATIAAAEKAGYFQYTAEDKTGAISYVNLNVWNSIDPNVPNQLWYDASGKLLGVDYTILDSQSATVPAALFGYAIDPSRWLHRTAHMHFGFTLPDGSLKFGAMAVGKFTDAGGVASENQATLASNKVALVKAGVPGLTSPEQVKFVFLHPAMWDLIAWVLPNPDGAWADANPNVKPTQSAPAAMVAQMSPAPMMASAMPMASAAPAQIPLTAAEQTLYQNALPLLKLYPTPAAAEKAGWFRFNNEDRSGAISYVNPAYFTSPDALHPQQLWYDANGRLMGVDFSQLVAAAPNGPTLFGILPARFDKVPLHIHYGMKLANGTIDYGLFVRASDFTAAGLDPTKATAADLVKLGKVKSVSDVAFVFSDLSNWDATMWLIPNPAGQFAEKNPTVLPSANQGKMPSERQT